MKDTEFYNKESLDYSSKRYVKVAQSYTQFFFNRRLSIARKYIAHVLARKEGQYMLLELGCADGVVVREFETSFPGRFSKVVGIDVSPGMIEEARRKNESTNAEFLLRSEYINRPSVDIVNETGVINYAGFDADIRFVYDNLVSSGWYILSVAGTGSLLNWLKGERDFIDFRSYAEYEKLLREKFVIHHTEGCGIFVPHLWKLPMLARVVQPLAEVVFGKLFAGLCHEKVYLAQKK